MAAVLFVYPRSKKWDLGMSLNGFLGGLVAITAPCYWVSPGGAVLIGAIAGCLVPLGVDLLERLRIDDPIGAVAVHGFVGIWGTLAVGLFATGQFGVPGPEAPTTRSPSRACSTAAARRSWWSRPSAACPPSWWCPSPRS